MVSTHKTRRGVDRRVTTTSLSDGRDIIYFDDLGSPETFRPADQRSGLIPATTPQIRKDPLSGEWVSVAPSRNERAYLPAVDDCPLCTQTTLNDSEIPGEFDVVVFENRSPSFGPQTGVIVSEESGDFGIAQDAVGRCEVVVFSPDHDDSFATLPGTRIDTVLFALSERTAALKQLDGVRTVFPFENRGSDIGVTLSHPHGQIYAYPFEPPRIKQLLQSAHSHNGDFYGDYLAFERRSPRVIWEGQHFLTFVPFGARWPIEVIIMPFREVADFTGLNDAEMAELSDAVPRILHALDQQYQSETPYIAAWYQAPVGVPASAFRFHFRLTSPKRSENKLKFLAGSETAMGAFVLDVTPENQAARFRDLL